MTRLLRDYVPVKVDLTVDEALAARYGVVSTPDLFLLTPNGEVVNRITRFVEPGPLATFLRAGLVAPERLPKEERIPWASSYAAAEEEAKRKGKPLFVYVWNYG